eukprot:1562074-Prymnesium_polylepis.1
MHTGGSCCRSGGCNHASSATFRCRVVTLTFGPQAGARRLITSRDRALGRINGTGPKARLIKA